MSNLIPANVQLPAHLAARLNKPSALSAALGGGLGGGISFPTISIKGSRFRIHDGDTETVLQDLELNVVIVGANPNLSKTYYAKKWSPDQEAEQPDCQSLDGIRPTAESPNKQSDICATCEHNVWGSKINPQTGAKQKACSDVKRLAVVAADDPTGPVYLLRVTPAALKGLNQYHKELSMRGIPAEVVVTKVSFDTNASFPLLKFGFGGFIDEDAQAALDDLFGSDKVLEITGEKQAAPQMIPVAQLEAPAAPKQKEVTPEPVEEAPAPAPVATGSFGKKKAAEAAPAPAPAPKAKAKAEPEVVTTGATLADEIAALVGEIGDDDA